MFAVWVYLRAGVGSGVGVVNGGSTKREIKEITGIEKEVTKLQWYFVDYLQRGLKSFYQRLSKYTQSKIEILTVAESLPYFYCKVMEFLERGWYKDIFLAGCNFSKLCLVYSLANSNSIDCYSFVLYTCRCYWQRSVCFGCCLCSISDDDQNLTDKESRRS